MKIITKKQQKEIEDIKKQNEFLPKGFRAMSQVLDYQRAIVSILHTLNLKEIEVSRTINNTTKIRIRQTGGKR